MFQRADHVLRVRLLPENQVDPRTFISVFSARDSVSLRGIFTSHKTAKAGWNIPR